MLFSFPHIKVNGEQLLLFNIIDRKFVLFGKVFWPQDMFLFALAIIIGLIFIILFTIIFGRLFCGWVCPQTIFMEMVFRRIEYWIEGDWTHQKKLDNDPWNGTKIFKRLAKHSIFWLISFLIANTFLAYIIGSDALWAIQTDPFGTHLSGLISLIIFTTVFYLVFARLREQVCTTICPYGRLQGVLLDKDSMVVAYDHKRGENRGKFRKGEDRQAAGKGDCVDCDQCVHVCPTGIDIRNGTTYQMTNDGMVSNIFEVNLLNKTRKKFDIELELEGKEGVIVTAVDTIHLKAEAQLKERFIIKLPLKSIENGTKNLKIVVLGNGEEIQTVKTKFIGPSL